MQHILLYGNSIFLAGLASQLRALPEVEVRQQAPRSGPLHLGRLDVVVVDFDVVEPADVLNILRARFDLRVVGVNAATSAVTVWHSQVYLAESVEEVARTICDF